PASRDSVSDGKTGVTRATPSSRSRARSISGRPGAVTCVAIVDPEHLSEYPPYSRQWVDLWSLHFRKQPPQLGIVGDSLLEMTACPARRDREHLAGEIRPAPYFELPALVEERPILLD